MQAATKLWFSLVLEACALVAIGAIFVLHRQLYGRLAIFRRLEPSRAVYYPAVTRLLVVAYTSLVLTPLKTVGFRERVSVSE